MLALEYLYARRTRKAWTGLLQAAETLGLKKKISQLALGTYAQRILITHLNRIKLYVKQERNKKSKMLRHRRKLAFKVMRRWKGLTGENKENTRMIREIQSKHRKRTLRNVFKGLKMYGKLQGKESLRNAVADTYWYDRSLWKAFTSFKVLVGLKRTTRQTKLRANKQGRNRRLAKYLLALKEYSHRKRIEKILDEKAARMYKNVSFRKTVKKMRSSLFGKQFIVEINLLANITYTGNAYKKCF